MCVHGVKKQQKIIVSRQHENHVIAIILLKHPLCIMITHIYVQRTLYVYARVVKVGNMEY